MSDSIMLSRRAMLEATVGALVASVLAARPLPALEATRALLAAPKPLFFTPAEFALLDELSDIIIPTDAHSPGAKAAGCAKYIDFRLSDSLDPGPRTQWREGLASVDALAKEMHGKTFVASTPVERVAIVTKMAANEADPKEPIERFFRRLKSQTARAYYGSKIGIHQEMRYKGNVFQKGEFAGIDVRKLPAK